MQIFKKIAILAFSATLAISALLVPSSAFVMIQGEEAMRYAINPVTNISATFYGSIERPEVTDPERKYYDVNITPLNYGTQGNYITSGFLTFQARQPGVSEPGFSPLPAGASALDYSVTCTSARIFTKIEVPNGLSGVSPTDFIVGDFEANWDAFVFDISNNTEFNLDYESLLSNEEVIQQSTWSGLVQYPRVDGTLEALPFSITRTNRFTLANTPDGSLSGLRRVRFFALPTDIYSNQNPQTLDYHLIYETAYNELVPEVRDFYVTPETITEWEAEENTNVLPIMAKYSSSHSCNLVGTSQPLPCKSLQVGSHATTGEWNTRFATKLDTLSRLVVSKRTTDTYDFSRVISNAINSTLGTTLFPGFTIGDVFTIVVGLSLVGLLLRLFLGG